MCVSCLLLGRNGTVARSTFGTWRWRTNFFRRKKEKEKEKEKEEEKELLELQEAVQERKQQLEGELWEELDDYIFSWEPEQRRSGTLNAKIWLLVQGSSNTKSENMEHDFDEIAAKIDELGWNDDKRLTRNWDEKEEGSTSSVSACLWCQAGGFGVSISSPSLIGSGFRVLRMESIIDLVADSVSLEELLELHALSFASSCSFTTRFDE